VALAPVSAVAQTLRSTLLGAACHAACKGTIHLIDDHKRVIATARIAISSRAATIIRARLSSAGRSQLRRVGELHTTASIMLGRSKHNIRIPLLLAR
jgi:hypothetical protein